ncbi:MAG TPA: hypothetical protein VMM15_01820 [Bradyrhizobium sp.]|nr:hypothetical protein [Bradyrhizobium sp.]
MKVWSPAHHRCGCRCRPEKLLVTIILLLFLLLHGLAGAMLKSANGGDTPTSGQDIRDMALRLHD